MKKKEKTNKSELVAIRFRSEEIEPYLKTIEKIGVTKSEFFRQVILNNYDKERLEEDRESSYSKLLFYYNKTSNNINQIARRINTESLKGKISDSFLKEILNRLEMIDQSLLYGIEEFKNGK